MTFPFCPVVFGFFTWSCKSTAAAAGGSGLVAEGRGVQESREGDPKGWIPPPAPPALLCPSAGSSQPQAASGLAETLGKALLSWLVQLFYF